MEHEFSAYDFPLEINGLTVHARFSHENVEQIFLPLLRRLTERKAASGTPPAEAEAFVAFSDMANASLCLKRPLPADVTLSLLDNDTYAILRPGDFA